MTASAPAVDLRLDRTMRRLGCLARLKAARLSAERLRRSTATDLEVLMRRVEKS